MAAVRHHVCSVTSSYNTAISISTFYFNIIHIDIATSGVSYVITISFVTFAAVK